MCRRTLTGGQYGHLSGKAIIQEFDTLTFIYHFTSKRKYSICFMMFNVQWLFNSLFYIRGSKIAQRLHAIVIFFEKEQLFTAVESVKIAIEHPVVSEVAEVEGEARVRR